MRRNAVLAIQFVLAVLGGCAANPHVARAPQQSKDATVSDNSCSLGFRELFHFAKGRPWTAEEGAAFGALSQPERNDAVKALAREANERAARDRAQERTAELGAGSIKTEDRLGTDGVTYTAFWLDVC